MNLDREFLFLLWSIPFYTFFIGAEIIVSNWGDKKIYSLKGVIQNILLTVMNASLDLLLRTFFVIAILNWSYSQHFFTINNPFIYWALLFILEDIAFYFEHRADHYCRLFWAVHLTHHSSKEYNLSTGFRSSVFQPVYRFIYFIPITLFGFEPLDILFMYSVTQTYGIIVHTQYIKKMPSFIEAIFVTPAHHRVHHASNIIYLDKNMGMCLIIWDKMFGTFQKELPAEPVVYGLTSAVENPSNALNHVGYEWKKILKDMKRDLPFFVKLQYIFMPPGWSHDGSTKTAMQLRKQLLNTTH